MDSIRVTPETRAQYLADCIADRRAELGKVKRHNLPQQEHDIEFVGKFIFVPQAYLTAILTKAQIRALVALHTD